MDSDRRKALAAMVGAAGGAVSTRALANDVTAGGRFVQGEPSRTDIAGRVGSNETIIATDFVKGDDSTICDSGLLRMHALVSRRAAAGNTVSILWPAGRYVYTSMPNWAITMLHIHFEGEVWLINNGRGESLTFDGGAASTGVYGLRVSGFPRIYGNRTSRNGVYARSIYRSQFEISCRGAGENFAGFRGEWLVSNEIRFNMNFNEGGLFSRPAQGMVLTTRANQPNFQSSYNSLYEPEFSGLPRGLILDGALGNKVFGGAFQRNDLGIEISESAWANKVFAADFEANEIDVMDCGRSTQFYGCDFERGPILSGKSRRAMILGGETNSIEIAVGADSSLISGVIWNRFGTGRVNDAGTLTRLRDLRNAQGAPFKNPAGDEVELQPRVSPFVYTNKTTHNQAVLVHGGRVTRLQLSRTKDILMPHAGQYVLGPMDGIAIDFDDQPPTIVVWAL